MGTQCACVCVFPGGAPWPQLKRDYAPARSSAAQLSSARLRAATAAAAVKRWFPVHIPHLPGCVIVGPDRGGTQLRTRGLAEAFTVPSP